MTDQPLAQRANTEMVDLMRPWFVDRNEPNYAWRAACSAVLALPALRAFWPMSSVDYTVASRARDVAGGGYHLSDNNTPTFGYGQLVPYVEFDGVNQYLSRADGGAANWADITGAEAYIASPGLTLGGWFYFDNDPGATNEFIFCKNNGAGAANMAYALFRFLAGGGGTLNFRVSDGAAVFSAATTGSVSGGSWLFIIGRYITNTEVSIFVNNVEYNNAIAPIAAIQDMGAPVTIGARGDPANYMDGRASLCFLCAAALSDSIITALYHNTRKLYGV